MKATATPLAYTSIPTARSIGHWALSIVLAANIASAQALDWPVERPPRPLAAREVQFPPYEVRTLANGMQVIAVLHHEQPAVSMRLLVRAGSVQDPAGKLGVASLTAALLDQGTATRSADQIAHPLEPLSADLMARGGVARAQALGTFTYNLDLRGALAKGGERPSLVMVHHPPFETGIDHMDSLPMRGAQALAGILAEHRGVLRVVAGHVHRTISATLGGRACTTCPSTAHHFALDLEPGMPARWTPEPPGFQVHRYLGGERLATHSAAIEDFPATRAKAG